MRSKAFQGTRAWDAIDIANMNGTTVRVHWTDQPYRWHVNDGEEVFSVLDGTVEMHYREGGIEHVAILEAGDIFCGGRLRTRCASAWRSASARRRARGKHLAGKRAQGSYRFQSLTSGPLWPASGSLAGNATRNIASCSSLLSASRLMLVS